MTRLGKPFIVALMMAGAFFLACSSPREVAPDVGDPTGTTGSGHPGPGGDTGAVGATLVIGTNVTLASLGWTISGPNSYSGVEPIGNAQSVEFVAGGIAAGSGYTISVFGVDSESDPCAGTSNPFGVLAGQTTSVTLLVTCTVPTDASLNADIQTGSVAVDASVILVNQPPIVCPAIASFSVDPAELAVGQGAQLGVAANAPSTVEWSVTPPTGGSFVNPVDGGPGATSLAPEFLCATPGSTVTVTVTIGLLDSGACTGVAFTSLSAAIVCEPQCNVASDCPAQDTVCSVPTCTAGLCGVAEAAEGTSCGAGDICNGAGSCVPFTFDVVRIGAGDGGLLTTVAAPVFIEQRLVSDGGLMGAPIALPTIAPDAGQEILTMPGTAAIAGLSRSQDGHYLSMAGYNAALGTANPANSADTIVVARIDSAGNVDTSTQFSSAAFHSANSIRSSVTADGTSFWVGGLGGTVDGGSTGGIWYIPFGVVDGAMLNATAVRLLAIYHSQLYGSGDTTAGEVFSIGTGLPDGGSPAVATLPGLPTVSSASASPWQFVFVNMSGSGSGPDTLYIADDTLVSGQALGIARFALVAGTWKQTATLTLPSADGGAAVGFGGLAGLKTGNSQVTLIASTATEIPNRIAVFTDDGVSSPWSGTSSVVAAANAGGKEYFRGVALSPR
jgi:hypothetical protein